jgi:hypothetical protein
VDRLYSEQGLDQLKIAQPVEPGPLGLRVELDDERVALVVGAHRPQRRVVANTQLPQRHHHRADTLELGIVVRLVDGLSVAFLEDDVDAAQVKAAIADKAEESGWNSVPRPAPVSETIYRVIRNG